MLLGSNIVLIILLEYLVICPAPKLTPSSCHESYVSANGLSVALFFNSTLLYGIFSPLSPASIAALSASEYTLSCHWLGCHAASFLLGPYGWLPERAHANAYK